jgi:hypothetical protein
MLAHFCASQVDLSDCRGPSCTSADLDPHRGETAPRFTLARNPCNSRFLRFTLARSPSKQSHMQHTIASLEYFNVTYSSLIVAARNFNLRGQKPGFHRDLVRLLFFLDPIHQLPQCHKAPPALPRQLCLLSTSLLTHRKYRTSP